MRALRLLWKVIRETDTDRVLFSLVLLTLAIAEGIVLVEPGHMGYGDALWCCFSAITTIGFGDVTVSTQTGRILVAIVGLSGIVTIGLVTGVVVAFYNEMVKVRANESLLAFADQLERLPELSPAELEDLSAQVKRMRHAATGRKGTQGSNPGEKRG